MDVSRIQTLAGLIGSVSISELTSAPYTSEPSLSDYYLTYKNSTDETANVEMKKTPAVDIYNYLLVRLFFFLTKKDTSSGIYDLSGITDVLDGFSETSQLSFGRYLVNHYSSWMGTQETHRICDYFLSQFQYFYFESLSTTQTMLIDYKVKNDQDDSTKPDYQNRVLDISMWDSNLSKENKLSGDAGRVDLDNLSNTINEEEKVICIPNTSISNGKFKKRNYAKIVDGDTLTTDPCDSDWVSTDGFEDNESGEIKDDAGATVTRDRLGDIDASIKAIGDYLDDWNNNLANMVNTFDGMVEITTNPNVLWEKDSEKVDKWDDTLFNNRFIYCSSGKWEYGGSNNIMINGVVSHNHASNDGVVQNISIVGEPEGMDVGGVAVANSIKKTSVTTMTGKATKDTLQTVISKPSYAGIKKGPYSGHVKYSATKVEDQIQQAHNNMPLYYRVRVVVKKR